MGSCGSQGYRHGSEQLGYSLTPRGCVLVRTHQNAVRPNVWRQVLDVFWDNKRAAIEGRPGLASFLQHRGTPGADTH